jgi:hypothetical protein
MKRLSKPIASAASPAHIRWLCTRSSSHQKVRSQRARSGTSIPARPSTASQ